MYKIWYKYTEMKTKGQFQLELCFYSFLSSHLMFVVSELLRPL